MTKIYRYSKLLLFLTMSFPLWGAYSVHSHKDGYLYTDLSRSRIYVFEDSARVLLEGPGVGYYYSVSPDQRYIGFKWRERPGGLEAPALYDLENGVIRLLHEPVTLAGQVSFSSRGDIAYTIANTLFVIKGTFTRSFDLGTYASLAPLSPDGKKVVYNDRKDQLWILDLENGNREIITQSNYGNVMPSWSAESRYIAYNRLDGILFIYDTQSGRTQEIGRGADLRWSESGDSYLYTRIELDDAGSIINTDIVFAGVNGELLAETRTPDVFEDNPWFMQDGGLAYLQDQTTLVRRENPSLKKQTLQRKLPDRFPTDPVFFENPAPAEDLILDVPYIHQVYDTPGPRGYSSCAPTTAAMVMAYYGILPKWPFMSGFNYMSDYGAYVHERYYYNGTYFNQSRQDCNTAQTVCYTNYGGYGYMWTGGSPNSRMNNYFGLHGISGNQTWNTSWSTVAAGIDKREPFSICNYLSSAGHLIAAIGRSASEQRTVIVNDPYGDRNRASWPNYYGAGVYYDWPGYNHGHTSLNYANSSYSSMPWCIATQYTPPAPADSLVEDKHFNSGFYIKAEGNTVPMRYYHSENNGHGGHHWWTSTEAEKKDICFVTWTPQLDKSGYYEIFAYIPANASAVSAPYRIRHAAGETLVTVDQSSINNDWISLGKYLFSNDGNDHVYLGDSSGVAEQIVAFDAVKWESADSGVMDFFADYRVGVPEYGITFTAITPLPEGEYRYLWDFGDGQSGSGESVSHAYGAEGTYHVNLSIEAKDAAVQISKENYIWIISNIKGDFSLVSPDSMELVRTQTPRLIWEAVPSAEHYLLYIGETLDFGSMTPIVCDTNFYRLTEALAEDKTAYWHVRAVSAANDTLRSTFWRFEVNSVNSAPYTFALQQPLSGSIQDTLRPSFSWDATEDPDLRDSLHYRLILGTHPDSMFCVYTGNTTAYTMTEDLKENAYYRWYVEAVDAASAASPSREIRNFAVNSINEAPSAPVQLAPLHNSYQTTRYPHMEWTAATDPDPGDQISYRIYYGQSDSTMNFVINTNNTAYDKRSFIDRRAYYWTVAAIDKAGLRTFSDTLVFYIDSELDVAELPQKYILGRNYPNPFNPRTSIPYAIPEAKHVRIRLYDLSGKKVATLIDAYHAPGTYVLEFNAADLPSGIYVYGMESGDFLQSRKMLLMK